MPGSGSSLGLGHHGVMSADPEITIDEALEKFLDFQARLAPRTYRRYCDVVGLLTHNWAARRCSARAPGRCSARRARNGARQYRHPQSIETTATGSEKPFRLTGRGAEQRIPARSTSEAWLARISPPSARPPILEATWTPLPW